MESEAANASNASPVKLSILGRMHARWAYAPRNAELTRLIAPKLQPAWRVLDVGCGSGALGAALRACTPSLHVEGVDVKPRPHCPISVTAYAGGRMPFEDKSFDAVIIADVLHHEREPRELLAEALRLARELVVVKDHVRRGFLAQSTISLLDWAANAPYGVPCLYRYFDPSQWRELFAAAGGEPLEEVARLKLYAWWLNPFFSRRLHMLAFLKPQTTPNGASPADVGCV
jgi:SAM-dependent methyltransferase